MPSVLIVCDSITEKWSKLLFKYEGSPVILETGKENLDMSMMRSHLAIASALVMSSALGYDGSHRVPKMTLTLLNQRPSKASRGGYDVSPKNARPKHRCNKRRNH